MSIENTRKISNFYTIVHEVIFFVCYKKRKNCNIEGCVTERV